MVAAILTTTAIVIAVILTSLCIASGRGSRAEERRDINWAKKWNEQREKKKVEGYKYCDNECLYCHQNDWCKFSEIKRE